MKYFYQTPRNQKGDMELLEVYPSGKVKCSCLAQMYNARRDFESTYCHHIKRFLNCVAKGDINEYQEVFHLTKGLGLLK